MTTIRANGPEEIGMKHVIIGVYGGAAEVEYASEDIEKLNVWPGYKNKRPRISSFYSDEELWAMKEERDMTRVELSVTKQELATAKAKISLIEERLTKAYRVRDELDLLIQSIIPTLTAEIRRLT